MADNGSKDKTLSILKEYDVNLLHRKWADNFEIQKNNSFEKLFNWNVDQIVKNIVTIISYAADSG